MNTGNHKGNNTIRPKVNTSESGSHGLAASGLAWAGYGEGDKVPEEGGPRTGPMKYSGARSSKQHHCGVASGVTRSTINNKIAAPGAICLLTPAISTRELPVKEFRRMGLKSFNINAGTYS